MLVNNNNNKPNAITKTFGGAAIAAGPRVALGAADTFVASSFSHNPLVAGVMGCVKGASSFISLCRSGGSGGATSAGVTKAGGDFVAMVGLFCAAGGVGPAAVAITAAGEAIGTLGCVREYYEDK